MALTEEQKRKIEDEERYRAHLRSGGYHEKITNKKGRGCLKLAFLIIGLPLLGLILFTHNIVSNIDTKSGSGGKTAAELAQEETSSELVGNVNFDGTQFHIRNEDIKDWTSCWFKLNNDYYFPTSAPSQKFEGIKVGEVLDLGAGQFTLKDGTRFNPFSIKPTSMTASCNGTGFGFWTW